MVFVYVNCFFSLVLDMFIASVIFFRNDVFKTSFQKSQSLFAIVCAYYREYIKTSSRLGVI